jgi:hypothetical protein
MVQNPTRTVSISSDGGVKVKSSKNRKPAKAEIYLCRAYSEDPSRAICRLFSVA